MDHTKLKKTVEALLLATEKPLSVLDISSLVMDISDDTEMINTILGELREKYAPQRSGVVLAEVEPGSFQLRTNLECSEHVAKIFSKNARPLSRAAQETMAIIAYRQPVTRADIEFIRGVDSGSIIRNLLEKNLITCVGRRADAGKPMIFGTTPDFLKAYGLENLKDLPPLDAFQPKTSAIKESQRVVSAQEAGESPPEQEIII